MRGSITVKRTHTETHIKNIVKKYKYMWNRKLRRGDGRGVKEMRSEDDSPAEMTGIYGMEE